MVAAVVRAPVRVQCADCEGTDLQPTNLFGRETVPYRLLAEERHCIIDSRDALLGLPRHRPDTGRHRKLHKPATGLIFFFRKGPVIVKYSISHADEGRWDPEGTAARQQRSCTAACDQWLSDLEALAGVACQPALNPRSTASWVGPDCSQRVEDLKLQCGKAATAVAVVTSDQPPERRNPLECG